MDPEVVVIYSNQKERDEGNEIDITWQLSWSGYQSQYSIFSEKMLLMVFYEKSKLDDPIESGDGVHHCYFLNPRTVNSSALEKNDKLLISEVCSKEKIENKISSYIQENGPNTKSNRQYITRAGVIVNCKLGEFLDWKKVLSNLRFSQYYAMAAALLTKGFVILGGVSGVGKTHMARTFSGCCKSVAQGGEFSTIPVSPSWTDETYVTGYWNPLKNEWEKPECLQLMEKAATDTGKKPYFAIFDEMNIARPEYYMPNLLSVMEIRGSEVDSSRDGSIKVRKKSTSTQPEDDFVPLTSNMFIIGTANTDESTFNFSPKVIDRAFYFKFTADDIEFVFPSGGNDDGLILQLLAEKFIGRLSDLDKTVCSPRMQVASFAENSWQKKSWNMLKEILEKINNAAGSDSLADPDSPVAFGTRCLNEMTAFLVNFLILADDSMDKKAEAGDSAFYQTAFDWAVRTKLLPKFSGSESQLNVKIDKLKEIVGKELNGSNSSNWSSLKQIDNVINRIAKDGYYIY